MDKPVEKYPEIYDYILQEEKNYRIERVPLASNWRDWNMYEHIDRSFQLKNSKFYKGSQDFSRMFHNIILPIANVGYRTEGFDVKDVSIYVDNADEYHKSLLARKYHKWWAKENHIDTAIDESVVSYWDYGLTLVKNVNEARPEVIQLQQIAFCDQTDILSGPICLKHYYSVDQLVDMKGKWDGTKIDQTLMFARTTRGVPQSNSDTVKTPGKYVEVYELHGTFPESWLGEDKLGEDWVDTGKYVPQLHIVSYYTSPIDGIKKGITLFKGKEPKPVFKALARDPIHGRACGRGGIEELFHPQIWANWSMKQVTDILEAIATIFWASNDPKLKNQKLKDLKKGQVLFLDDGKDLVAKQINSSSKIPFDQFLNLIEQNARTIGSASDPQLGLNPVSGTPLGTTEIVTKQGEGPHAYHQGRLAEFWAEIYRDWGLPHFAEELNKGSKWLDELSLDELQTVADNVATCEANDRYKAMVLDGKIPPPGAIDTMKQVFKEAFMKAGNKRFLEVIKDDFKDLPMDVEIDVAGKQEALFDNVAKMNSLWRAVFTPVGLQTLKTEPAASELLNQILEKSGFSPIDFNKVGASYGNTGSPPMQSMPSPVSMNPQMNQLTPNQ